MHHKKAKPYQKHEQFPKPHQKHEKWVQEELELHWSIKPLTDTEIEELFWRKLVQLGWRSQSYGDKAKKTNIVLPCPYCYKVLDTYPWGSITKTDTKRMTDKEYCKQMLKDHNGFVCKPIDLSDED
jgi:hypothetical protein